MPKPSPFIPHLKIIFVVINFHVFGQLDGGQVDPRALFAPNACVFVHFARILYWKKIIVLLRQAMVARNIVAN